MAAPDPCDDAQVAGYRELLENARAMLAAAREQRWDDLGALDGQRQTCLQRIVEQDLVCTRPDMVEAKADLIQRILECDEQTRALAHAWREEVGQALDSLGNARKLAHAYGDG